MDEGDDFMQGLAHLAEGAQPVAVATHGLFRVSRDKSYRPTPGAFHAPRNAPFAGHLGLPPDMGTLEIESGQVSAKSQREALAACMAVQVGAVLGPIRRGDNGPVDFYDVNDRPFDVKTPAGGQNIQVAAQSVIDEMEGGGQMGSDGQNYLPRVVLDTTFLTNVERGELWSHLVRYVNERRLIEVVLPYNKKAKVVKFG